MRLCLMRHGEAVNKSVDPARPLTTKGRGDTERIALVLKQASFNFDIVCHSGKTRAEQTAAIVRDVVSPQASFEKKEGLGPNDAIDDLVYDISAWDQDVVVVGHLPYLSVLTSRLVANNESKPLVAFQTSTAVILENDSNGNWYIVSVFNPEYL
ncbi:MAG: phosphohistidine phosphatase SixA [Candidatus Omnitrophica bacterium]|nr:phosphohistidine phosphatase SixA [Candidatus Omnitrophota bacterium]